GAPVSSTRRHPLSLVGRAPAAFSSVTCCLSLLAGDMRMKYHGCFHAQSNARVALFAPARHMPGLYHISTKEQNPMETTQATVNNGVNVEALLGAREALSEAPQAAKFTWRAT